MFFERVQLAHGDSIALVSVIFGEVRPHVFDERLGDIGRKINLLADYQALLPILGSGNTGPDIDPSDRPTVCAGNRREPQQIAGVEISPNDSRKLAHEYDAAQDRGEVAKVGKPNCSKVEQLPDQRISV